MKTEFARWIAILILATLSNCLWAQTDEIGTGFKRPDAAEEQKLRAILAEPVPQNALNQTTLEHFRTKESAARRLGDVVAHELVLRDAIGRLPDSYFRTNLAFLLLEKGEFAASNELMREALNRVTDPYNKAFYTISSAFSLFYQYQDEAARQQIEAARALVLNAERSANVAWQQLLLSRTRSILADTQASLEQRAGRLQDAIAAASEAVRHGRRSMTLLTTQREDQVRTLVLEDLSRAMARKLRVQVWAGQLSFAEETLAEYLRLSREATMPPRYLASIYWAAAELRFAEREFVQAETFTKKSNEILTSLGYEDLHGARTRNADTIVLSQWAQRKWEDALAELQRLDGLAGTDEQKKSITLHRLGRGLIYLSLGRHGEAASLFQKEAEEARRLNGETHFLAAQAIGLQGAALWRTGVSEHRAEALPLLKTAVRDYMAPANVDFLENIGIRKELREIVFAAYLEAMANTPGEDATSAISAADWVRGGTVQDALSDAAVRAAASTPALADVVRREQDAKNEVTGIRRYLSGEAGAARAPLPQVAAQMRERIAVLEGERAKLQAEIKAKFPDYERLVRPTPPTVQDIARQLDPQQALLMLLPTTDAVYVWAVASDRPAAFVRANLTEVQVNALVSRLRRQLDFAFGTGVSTQFDSAAAFELYDKLLAPLAAVWQGKTQLVVAAGGTLSQLPFGVLQTRAGGFAANAPWLIRDASIAQVPSLSAWLAIKSIAKGKSAAQAFAGWGDPTFGVNVATAAGTTGSGAATQARSIALTRASALADLDALQKTTPIPSALKYADIPALPDTREELLAIAATLKADTSSDVLLGNRATRESVLAASKSGLLANKRVIAFATHGLMAGDLPNLNQPALAMAATGNEAQNPLAPLLTLEDVLTLKLNADWVVLSACNTAAADGKAEEALSGLARGFFYAGSRSLLVTHWAVESESAKLLTTSTFEHYTANPQAPKAESLRQAMLKVMAMPKYAHPAFWAPYALVGDGGR